MRLHYSFVALFAVVSLAACAGSAEESATAEGALAPPPMKITVKSSDSKAAATFLDAFMGEFMSMAIDEANKREDGASTSDELDKNIFKMERNDGSIECEGIEKTTCTFDLKPKEMIDGVPVLEGDRNTLAGRIHGTVAFGKQKAVVLASRGGAGGEAPKAILIGDHKAGIFIECTDGPPDGLGFRMGVCAFQLQKK
jgi:hypothetical protein